MAVCEVDEGVGLDDFVSEDKVDVFPCKETRAAITRVDYCDYNEENRATSSDERFILNVLKHFLHLSILSFDGFYF